MPIKIKPSITIKTDEPKMYLISILSDNYISSDFCLRALVGVFHKSIEQANAITHEIKSNGEGICGAYIFEIAETKAVIVEKQAKREGFSIRCLIEEV